LPLNNIHTSEIKKWSGNQLVLTKHQYKWGRVLW